MTDHDLNMTHHENISILQEDFRAGINQIVAGAGNDLENPETRQIIELIEKKNADYLEKTRICISGKNSIPGFRQVVILSPDLILSPELYTDPDIDMDTGWPGIIAVTSDGRLVTGSVRHRSPDNKKPIVPKQVIDVLQDGQSGPEFPDGDYLIVFENSDKMSMSEISIHRRGSANNYITIGISLLSSSENYIQSEVYKFLKVQMENRINMIRDTLFASLDKNLLSDMQKSSLMKIEYGYWLTGGDGASKNVVIARQQSIRAYPALAEQLYYQFCNTIDARESLSSVIAEYYYISGRKLKRIQGLTREYIDIDLEYPDQHIMDIFEMPDHTVPKNQQQFRQLKVIRKFGRDIWNLSLPETMRRFSESGNLWQLANRMEQTSVDNILDSVDFLVRKLLVPIEINRIPPDRSLKDYFGVSFDEMITQTKDQVLTYFSIRELLDLDQRYHRNIARYEDRLDIVTMERNWSGMLGTIDLDNGYRARELTSSKTLKVQGRTENHCVGGYVSKILSSRDHSSGQATMIFSIEQDDQILSTAEINCFREFPESDNPEQLRTKICQNNAHSTIVESDNPGQLWTEVSQNSAHSNTSPSDMAETLAKQVAARVQQAGPKAFQTYLDGLHESRMEQEDRFSGLALAYHTTECGLDPHNRAHLEIAWENLKPALPKRFRRNDLDTFIEYGLAGKPPEEPSRTNRPDHGQSDKTGFSETEQEGILEYDRP